MILSEKMYERIDGRSLELLFDISSGSVSGAFVYFENRSLPSIMYKHTEDIMMESSLDSDNFKKNTLVALNKVCKNLIEKGSSSFEIKEIYEQHKNPKRAHLFFSSPWTDLDIKNIQFKKGEGDFEVFAKNLLEEIKDHSKGELISRDVNSVKISGYKLDLTVNKHDGLDQEVTDGELSYVSSYVLKSDIESIKSIIQRNFSLEDFYQYPVYKVLTDAVKSFYEIDKDFILIDLTTEMTDVFVVKESELALNFSIPFGRGRMVREMVEKKLAVTINQGRSILNAYICGHIKRDEEVEEYLVQKHLELKDNFDQGLETLSKEHRPKDIFVVSDKDNIPFLRDFIKKHFSDKNLIIVDKKKVSENLNIYEDNYDNFTALETLYIN